MHPSYRSNRPFVHLLAFVACWLVLASAQSALALSADDDASLLDRSSQAFVNVVKKAKPAVVHIRVEKTVGSGLQGQQYDEMFNNPFFEHFFGPQFRQNPNFPQRKQKQEGQGSGFILSRDGFILTNNHVVEGAETIKVMLADNREFLAKVIGTDPQTDVALIQIKDGGNLPTLPLGDSDAMEVGEWVIAIGNPFGLDQTVTVGVVSAKGRSRVGINEYENFIQTDAAINPGNSGGPLINTHGEVVGINSALFSRTGGYMGIGFAIPVNMVKSIQNQLQNQGKVTRGWLGVVIQDIDENLAKSFGLKTAEGILVSEVQLDSPAAKAGLKQGDVILKLDGTQLADVADLRNRVALIPPGKSGVLTIIRDGQEQQVDVAIGEQPSDFSKAAPASTDQGTSSLRQFGLSFQDLSPELAERLGYQEKQGVVVSEVEEGSPAAAAGMRPGQLIEEVNKKAVRNLKDLQTELKKAADQKRVLLRVRTGNYSQYVVLVSE